MHETSEYVRRTLSEEVSLTYLSACPTSIACWRSTCCLGVGPSCNRVAHAYCMLLRCRKTYFPGVDDTIRMCPRHLDTTCSIHWARPPIVSPTALEMEDMDHILPTSREECGLHVSHLEMYGRTSEVTLCAPHFGSIFVRHICVSATPRVESPTVPKVYEGDIIMYRPLFQGMWPTWHVCVTQSKVVDRSSDRGHPLPSTCCGAHVCVNRVGHVE